MTIATSWIRYGATTAYRAQPERAESLPGVIVLQEAFGVDVHIEDVARRFAAAGYVAVAPDLYSVDGQRPAALSRERFVEVLGWIQTLPTTAWVDPGARGEALATQPPDVAARLDETITAMLLQVRDLDRHTPALLATAAYLRTGDPAARGHKVGSLGFCMGGGLSGRLACADPELACAVVFYGMAPPSDQVARGRCPILAFYGADDPRVNATVPGFVDAMAAAQRPFEHHTYPATPHAFFNDSRPMYRAPAARDSFVRTLAWLQAHLA